MNELANLNKKQMTVYVLTMIAAGAALTVLFVLAIAYLQTR